MPNFKPTDSPPPILNKPKPKQVVQAKPAYIKTKQRFQVHDPSYYNKDIGNPDRQVLRGKEDYHIEFNIISLDGIYISTCGRFGIKYSREHTYILFYFRNPLKDIGDKQQILMLRDDLDKEIFVFQDKDDDVILGYIKTKIRDIVLKTRVTNLKTKRIEVDNNLLPMDVNINESEVIENVPTDNPTCEQSFNNESDSQTENETFQEERQEVFQNQNESKEIDKREEVGNNRDVTESKSEINFNLLDF
jgi:hypothetical protein